MTTESQLQGTYSSDLDLDAINKLVITYISECFTANYNHHMANFLKMQKESPLTRNQNAWDATIAKLEAMKKGNTSLEEYVKDTASVIEAWRSQSDGKESHVLKGRKIITKDALTVEERDTKLFYIAQYLEIASKYAPVSFSRSSHKPITCTACGEELKSLETCPGCGKVQGAEILPESDPSTESTRRTNLKANVKRGMSTMGELKTSTDELNRVLSLIEPFMTGVDLIGKYITFKIEQLHNPKVSPQSMGVDFKKKRFTECDAKWKEVVEKVNAKGGDIEYIPSF